MIAFNHNILFDDEPFLGDGFYDTAKENFVILKSSDSALFTSFPIISEYTPMSGREASYGADKVYRECGVGCRWGLDVKGVVSLVWVCGEKSIHYLPQEKFTPEVLQFWVLHTIIPMMLILAKQYEVLHVGAVEIEGSPVIFSAPSFGGKSTLIDFFVKQGHRLYADDTLAVYSENNQFMAVGSFSFHRPFRDPESLGYKVDHFATDPKPLSSIYILEKADASTPVQIKALKGAEKYRRFHYSSFIEFDFLKSYRFKNLSEIVKNVPVYLISVPWNKERLEEVYHAITEHEKS